MERRSKGLASRYFVPSLMSTAQVADPEQPPLRLAASTTHTCRTLMSGSKSQLCFLAQGLSSWFFTSVLKLFFPKFAERWPCSAKPRPWRGLWNPRARQARVMQGFFLPIKIVPLQHINVVRTVLGITSCTVPAVGGLTPWKWTLEAGGRAGSTRGTSPRDCWEAAAAWRGMSVSDTVATHYFKPDLIIWINLWTLRRALLKAKFLGTWSVCGSCANLEPISNKCTDRSSEEWRRLCRDRVQTWTRVHLYVRILFKVITWVNHSGMNNASELGGVGRGWSATDLTVLPYFLAWNITTFLLWCIWGWESKQILGCNPSCGCLGWNPSDQRTICWWNTSCMTSRESDAVIEFIDLE